LGFLQNLDARIEPAAYQGIGLSVHSP
jgi:hypothetical protein